MSPCEAQFHGSPVTPPGNSLRGCDQDHFVDIETLRDLHPGHIAVKLARSSSSTSNPPSPHPILHLQCDPTRTDGALGNSQPWPRCYGGVQKSNADVSLFKKPASYLGI